MGSRQAAQDCCRQTVTDVFPDICSTYVNDIADQNGWDPQRIVEKVLEHVENGQPYAKQSRKSLKRKATESDNLGKKARHRTKNSERVRTKRTNPCQCCYDEVPSNEMVHCNGDKPHWFCKSCARRAAETQVGLSKYQLICMSTDGCRAGFTSEQRTEFLDTTLRTALDRLEIEAVLYMADIKDLESCPFCDYAAVYPSVKENKEFCCKKCEIVSCRLCRRETHIPLTCEEAAQERGCHLRHQIEEAMSTALIRRCNKCRYSTP